MDSEIRELSRIICNKCGEKEYEKRRGCRTHVRIYNPWEPFWDLGC